MATASQDIDISALPKYIESLEMVIQDVPLDGLFDRIEMLLIKESLNCFDQSVDPNGNPWGPLKHPRTRGSGDPAPLRDTGVLMASMTATRSGTEGAIRDRGPGWIRFGTSIPYAAIHQYGGTIVPRQAQFLCIPATAEAAYAGSPTQFSRKLYPRINRTGRSGVLMDDTDTVQYYMTVEVKIDARPFIGFSHRIANKILMITDDWLLGQHGVVTKTFYRDLPRSSAA